MKKTVTANTRITTTNPTNPTTANNIKEENIMFNNTATYNPHTLYIGIGLDAEYIGDGEPDFIKPHGWSFEKDDALNNGGFYKSPLYEANSDEDNERYRLLMPFLCWLSDRKIVTDSRLCCLQIAINANYFGDYDEQDVAVDNLRKFAEKFWGEIQSINLAPHEFVADESPWDEYKKQNFAKKIGDLIVFKWHGTQDYLKLWAIIEFTKLIARLARAGFDLSSFEDFEQMYEVFTDTSNQFYKNMLDCNLYR